MLVVCNKADDPKCPGCNHDEPHHLSVDNDHKCTEWGTCFNNKGEPLFKVRCINVDSKQGRKVMANFLKP